MPKKVTLKDIAAKAGLSPASVSMILNRRSIDRFNAETITDASGISTIRESIVTVIPNVR